MDKALSLGIYLFRFIVNPAFQEEQAWVKCLIKKLAVIRPNYWTVSRFFGGVFTMLFSYFGFYWLDLLIFLLFALTDWVDGKVSRHLGTADNGGAFLDALADKFFVIPVLWYWGKTTLFMPLFWSMAIIEFGGNILIWCLDAFLFKKKTKKIYEHLMVGKYKFNLQIVLAFFLRIFLFSDSIKLQVFANTILFVITVFAALSIGFKIVRYFRGFSAQENS